MKPIRSFVPAIAIASLALIAGACAEAPVAPPSSELAVAVDGTSAIRKYPEGKAHTFTVHPGQNFVARVGDHTLRIPADGVCALKSSYGPAEWDTPCEAIEKPIQIQIKASSTELGLPRIDFSPKLRFVPGKDVMLELRHAPAALLEREVFYCPDNSGIRSGRCINEGAWDAELKTKHNKPSGDLIRKIKHFSGYEVAAT